MTVHPPKFSVLGDSISTFQGYCPVGAEHYAPDTGAATGVYTVEDTWWMQVIRAQGGVYLSNQSISGNTISPAGTMGGFSQKRLRGLSVEGEEPDHILLYAGLNDANFGIPLDVFAREYQALLGNLLALYPQVQIHCGTLLLGAIAGYGSRRVDDVIMRVMDIFLAIPSILLSIALVSAMGTSVTNMMLAISISNIPPFARIVRSAVLTIKNEEYIEAARAIGASDKRIILKHILPNCMAPIIVQATLSIAGSILAIASLSFIGLGISPPTPEWGSMVSTGRQYFRAAWWVCAFPGFAIMLTILSLNLLGDGLRDALDPKLKN